MRPAPRPTTIVVTTVALGVIAACSPGSTLGLACHDDSDCDAPQQCVADVCSAPGASDGGATGSTGGGDGGQGTGGGTSTSSAPGSGSSGTDSGGVGTGTGTGTASTDTVTGSGTTSTSGGASTSGSDPTSSGSDMGTSTTSGVTSETSGGTTTATSTCSSPADPYGFDTIWIPNTAEGTVSRIYTVTLTEQGRFRTGPGTPDPSRVAVSLRGEVAIANRDGSVTAIANRLSDCDDGNGSSAIDTSTGPSDVRPWGEDECVKWNVPLMGSGDAGPRALAWEPTVLDPATCDLEPPRLWVAHYSGAAVDEAVVTRITNDGQVEQSTTIPSWSGEPIGPRTGVAAANGDFLIVGAGSGAAASIDVVTFAVTVAPTQPLTDAFSSALAPDGRLWVVDTAAGMWTLDTGTLDWAPANGPAAGGAGIHIDRDRKAWIAVNGPCRLVSVDVETGNVLQGNIPLTGCDTLAGVSGDVDGFIWVVDEGADAAYKVNSDDPTQFDTLQGLAGPHAFGDLTGESLRLVVDPP